MRRLLQTGPTHSFRSIPMRSAIRHSALLMFVLVLAACQGESVFVPTIEDTNFAPSLGVDLAASTRKPSGLYYRDITVGAGAILPDTGVRSVNVTYSGALRNATVFDAGTATFSVGNGGLIAGFDEGLRGMRVGGRRQLIIPPNLGYGSIRFGSIPANSILVFDVTLNAIN